MELVCLWVEGYKNIQKQGFNFSPKFRCEYDGETLTIEENDDYIDDFFGENINVTAIVGKNGSGKSSVFEVLTQILSQDSRLKYFYVLYDGSQNVCYSNGVEVCTSIKIDEKNAKLKQYFEMYYLNISHLERDNIIKNDAIQYEDPLNYLGIYAKNDFEKNSDKSMYPSFSEFNLNKFNFLQVYTIGYLLTKEKYAKFFFELFRITKPSLLNIEYDESSLLQIKNSNTKIDLQDDRAIDESVPEKIDEILKFLKNNKQIQIGSSEYEKFFKLSSSVWNLEQEFKLTFLTESKQKIKFSSGEMTVLYYLNKIDDMLIEIKKDKQFTVLLWDEIELYLHPMWQKRILKIILDFVKTEKLDKLLHIIITTHSPFLLSDIPKQNIIFLDTDENGNCKVVNGLKEKKQTFGANIHTLLSDSFFMEDGLMGEFAKSKIDKVIKILNREKPSKEDLEYCEKIIPVIGEPIVKNQLQKMLDSKRLKKIDEIDKLQEEMALIKHRLDILRKQND
jgi:predicted ATP-dependent endonuclease of OLD family